MTLFKAMNMMDKPGLKLRLTRFAEALLLCALAISPLCLSTAKAAPSAVNQKDPSLADTPGNKSAVTHLKSMSEGSLKIQDGLAQIDSDVLLKVYYFAYSGTPVDYSAILTANTENIVAPVPVQPSPAQRQTIDKLIAIAKAHPDVTIKVDDIALNAYDQPSHSFEVVNRLFIDGARFYFDNSRYHYVYSGADAFRTLQCTDAKTIAAINSAVENYVHFSMDIVGHVGHAVPKDTALVIDLRKVTLKDAIGETVITQAKP
jgi:hypothetical protein